MKRTAVVARLLLAANSTLFAPSLALAQTAAPPPPAPAPAENHDAPQAIKISSRVGRGFTLSAGDDFAMTIRGRMMLRYALTAHDGEINHEATIRRIRLYLQGHTFSKDIQYFFHVGFAHQDYDPSSPSPLYDGYLQLTQLKNFNLRIGQQLVPFNRSRVISSQNAELVDRSIVNAELQLDRDVGVKVFSNDLGGLGHKLAYEAFVGLGEGRNPTVASNPGMLYVGRLHLNPLGEFSDYSESDLEHERTPKLSLGLAFAYNQKSVRQRGTTGARFSFADFDTVHGTTDLLFKYRGLSLHVEGIARWSPRESLTGEDDKGAPKTEHSRRAAGYFVQAGYVLEKPQIGIAARFSRLVTLGDTDPALEKAVAEQGKEIIFGLSYYVHGHVLKMQTDYAYLFGDDFSAGRHQARLQAHVGY